MLILGGLGENWTYPNEILDNDVQGEGRGLYQQNMSVCALSQSLCVGQNVFHRGFGPKLLAPRLTKRTDIKLFDFEAFHKKCICNQMKSTSVVLPH